ncbi:hypothetical protein IWW57_000691 [Coemansia sp. S610]|nr:hypothetical protein IWW57_000691 [Coemansia sp. S610]
MQRETGHTRDTGLSQRYQSATQRSGHWDKLLLGNLLAMKRQLAWYLGAYPEEEMGRCPLNHRREATEQQRETGEHQTRRRREEAPIETMAHYLECYSYSTDPAPAKAKDDLAEEG